MCLFRRYHRLRGMFSLCEGSITRGSMILWRVWKVVFLFQFQFFHISTLNLVKLNLILLILKRAWRKKNLRSLKKKIIKICAIKHHRYPVLFMLTTMPSSKFDYISEDEKRFVLYSIFRISRPRTPSNCRRRGHRLQ